MPEKNLHSGENNRVKSSSTRETKSMLKINLNLLKFALFLFNYILQKRF